MVQEIISVVERRRRWSTEDRVRILEEASRPGVVIASVLAKYQVSGSQFYRWRKQAREGLMPGVSVMEDAPAGFAPVMIAAPADDPAPLLPGMRKASLEIALPNGRSLKVDEAIDPVVLERLLAVVDS